MINKDLFRFLWQRPSLEISFKSWQTYLILFLFLILVPYPLFHGLDALVLRQYDDARRGVNAYEMLHNGDLLVTHYHGEPDLWGTKPPLLVWSQVIFMMILGPGELAVRLPSALAGLFTCLLIVLFSVKYLKNPLYGLFWSAVLITINGYVDFHGTRTGDFDAMLTFFMFLYSITFFLFTESKKQKFLIYTAVFITLAVLTKGIAGLLFLPALMIWALISKSMTNIFKSRQTYIGALIFLVIVGGYYLAREKLNPGYLNAVSENEVGGRYLEVVEGHNPQITYYIDQFSQTRLLKWYAFLLPSLAAGFFIREKFARNLHLFSLVLIVSHLLIITFSSTKLPWYDLPEFPFIALIIANFIWVISYIFYRFYERFRKRILLLLPVAFIILVFYEPVRLTFKEANYLNERPWYLPDQEISIFLRDGVRGKMNIDGYVLVFDGYDAQCLFYQYLLDEKGQKVVRKYREQLKPGDRVIVYQQDVKNYIEQHYRSDIIENKEYVRTYEILPNR
jgi:4-amino-4-deoxy-L-arabinose transferase-like glycosyltransferase